MPATSAAQPEDRVSLAEGTVDVWRVPLDGLGELGEALWHVLDSDERRRASEFRRDVLRRRFVAARGALRVVLGRYLGRPAGEVALICDARGKPRLAEAKESGGDQDDAGGTTDARLRFNVAHSGELALIAVTRGCDVGVDVEQLRTVERLEQLAARYFHPAEVAAALGAAGAAGAERSERFLRCWTGKEAVLKAIGMGLGADLRWFSVAESLSEAVWVELPSEWAAPAGRCWTQPVAAPPGYVGAVATCGQPRGVRLSDFAM